MKLKDTIKLFNYTKNKNMLIFIMAMFLLQCFMYLFTPMGTIMLGFMISLTSTYIVNFIYKTLVSGMVRQSGKVQKTIYKNFTILVLITNVGGFLLFIVPRYFFMLEVGNYSENEITVFLLNYILFNILSYISVAVIYKRMAFGTAILIVMAIAFFIQMPFVIFDSVFKYADIFLKFDGVLSPSGQSALTSTVGLLAAAFAVSIVSPWIFYAISILIRNYPISKYIEDRMKWD